MRASAHGLTSTVAKLLALGADVSAKDENGKGALMMAAKEGLEDLVCLLVESHAEVDGCDDKGKTALHYASERGHAHVVKVLLKIGADIEATDKVSQSDSRDVYTRTRLNVHVAYKVLSHTAFACMAV